MIFSKLALKYNNIWFNLWNYMYIYSYTNSLYSFPSIWHFFLAPLPHFLISPASLLLTFLISVIFINLFISIIYFDYSINYWVGKIEYSNWRLLNDWIIYACWGTEVSSLVFQCQDGCLQELDRSQKDQFYTLLYFWKGYGSFLAFLQVLKW